MCRASPPRPPGVKLHKLSSNETPLGPEPEAPSRAYKAAADDKLELYPDGTADETCASGHRRPLWPRPGKDHLRCRLG